jgi:RNA polymerase sigma-70 factor, ECF subfamily
MSAALARHPGRPAFEEVYVEFFPRLYAYLRSRLRHPVEAEDLTAEIFIKVLEAYPRFRPCGVSPSAWLFTIARNASRDPQWRGSGAKRFLC